MPTAEQYKAHITVATAIAAGRLAPAAGQSCVRCGNPAAHYHHPRGYALEHALDVEPYCRSCHRRAHDQEWREGLARRKKP